MDNQGPSPLLEADLVSLFVASEHCYLDVMAKCCPFLLQGADQHLAMDGLS